MSDELATILEVAVEVDKLRRKIPVPSLVYRPHTEPLITTEQLNALTRICRDRIGAAIMFAPILFQDEVRRMPRDIARQMIDLFGVLPEYPPERRLVASRSRNSTRRRVVRTHG